MSQEKLSFQCFDEVLERIGVLSNAGYTREGAWSLGQNCNHLASVMEFSQKYGETRIVRFGERIGFPVWVLHFASAANRLGIRVPTLPFARPTQSPETKDADGVKRYLAAIEKQQCRVNAPSCSRFQLWHASHHLGYLQPHYEEQRMPQSAGTPTPIVARAG